MNNLTPNGETFTELVLAIFRVNGLLLEAGDRITQPVGLTSARWQVLGVVEHGPAPVAHVARIMGLSRQSVQQTADTLERDGHIMYHENPHHRRSKLMEISQRGREALAYVEQRHADWANEAGRSYTLENLQEAARLLLQVADRLEQNAAPSQNEEI